VHPDKVKEKELKSQAQKAFNKLETVFFIDR